MKQKKQTYNNTFRISLLLILMTLLVAQLAANRADAAPPISEAQAIAIATGQEVGPNDFRISSMGEDIQADAFNPAVAYNPTDNEYLVVWNGDDNFDNPSLDPDLVNNEYEIYGQRVDAATGQEVGPNDFRISDMGPDANPNYDAYYPDIVYNPTLNQYLVVWEGDDDTGALVDEEFEIFGQLLAADGAEIGPNDFRISDVGLQDGNAGFDASDPAVAYDSSTQEYLVVWEGLELLKIDIGATAEIEIFGQRINAADGQEVGVNDFRISNMGPDGDAAYRAANPAIAYNSAVDLYLIVWEGDDNSGVLVDNEFEIFGQMILGDGTPFADDIRISHMGPDGATNFKGANPDVAYDPTEDLFLIVWEGDDNSGALTDEDFEIFGQLFHWDEGNQGDRIRISSMGSDGDDGIAAVEPSVAYDADNGRYLVAWTANEGDSGLADNEKEIFGQLITASGAETGTNDFRISDMGPDGNDTFTAEAPAIACSGGVDRCLVVWDGRDDIFPLIANESEIFGQLLQGGGIEIGPNDARLSDMGRDDLYDAFTPATAYNTQDNEYLVVWAGDDNGAGLADNEFEIFGVRIDAASGQRLTDDFRISNMGPDGDVEFGASTPAVAYDPTRNQYLVVWYGDSQSSTLANGDFEIFGQLLQADGSEIELNDFRISDMGPDGDQAYDAQNPAVVYNSVADEYLVVWEGRDKEGILDGESEIYGQRLTAATGQEVGDNDFRLSDMGPDGDDAFGAFHPAAAYNSANNQYLVIWQGEDDTGTLVDNEQEIFGQLLAAAGSETGPNDFRISDMGPDGDSSFDALDPALTYNPATNQYLVVWYGDDNSGELVNGEEEIFGQLVDAAGVETGVNDFRISHMGPDGDSNFDAFDPAVTYQPAENSYLVVWLGDDNTNGLVDGESEIFGQLLNANGSEIGADDFRLSDMGPDGDQTYDTDEPDVACQTAVSQCLTVWHGDDNTPPLVDNELEVFGQFVETNSDNTIFLPLVIQ